MDSDIKHECVVWLHVGYTYISAWAKTENVVSPGCLYAACRFSCLQTKFWRSIHYTVFRKYF